MEQENGNYLSLKAINQSVDDIRARNRSLERDLYNIIKLFHLYQRYIEHKIDRARNANEMALEFFSALDTEVNGVIRMVEESDLSFKKYTSSNKKTQQASSRSRPDSREPQTGISKDSWRKNFSKKTKEDTASTKIMNDLMINKDQMVREIQESQSSLNYILDYLRSLSFVKGQKNQNGSEQNSDSNRSVTSEPDPSKLLAMTDVDQFLIKTSNFFSNQKVPQEQDKSLKAYLVRIADLQKELKKKDNELELLRNQVSVTSPEQEAELRQLTGNE
jgi:hypothetical protein